MNKIFKTKSIENLIDETKGKEALQKVLGPFELTMLGIGAIVGTGIFVTTGVAASEYSGPALVLSFIISGIACGFAALCYAEFASTIPVAGSAYTYSYAALGEIWAWIIGWDLLLEYIVDIGTVAIGWSGYASSLLQNIGIKLPYKLINSPSQGGIVNLPAIIILMFMTGVLFLGVRNSARFNNVIVIIKLAVIFFFIFLGARHVKPVNWHPFMPYGVKGVFSGAAFVFFSYIGFDAVSTTAEEVKNPQKDLPIGIVLSLLICTVLYIAVSFVLTGMLPYYKYKNVSAPIAFALQKIGINWGSALVSVGAICGITSVLLVMMFGVTRILFAISRDGLLPKCLSTIHPKYKTPVKSIFLVGIATAIISGFLPIEEVTQLTNIGTLAAFIMVSIAVIVLRYKRPDLKRAFKCPLVPITPLISIVFCIVLIFQLQTAAKLRFIIWFILGLIVYALYGFKRSKLNESK
ncbi:MULTISPECIES: amino acid permease [Clostridium]|uniref:amino acid permease n=1 Tax=Clostridium TaxID=1485 RepID=UPI000823FBD5|nr:MULTISPECIES: amino acid permease [Clostridium]PJI06719.1 amino acid permease [Clostridium sp. CT7]